LFQRIVPKRSIWTNNKIILKTFHSEGDLVPEASYNRINVVLPTWYRIHPEQSVCNQLFKKFPNLELKVHVSRHKQISLGTTLPGLVIDLWVI
jgi:hypothetical protein